MIRNGQNFHRRAIADANIFRHFLYGLPEERLFLLGAGGVLPGTVGYDAGLHAILLGFVFAMVFGHAPIIFPAILGVRLPYHPLFYLPLAVLHLSVALRVGATLAGLPALRSEGGLLNALALALFVAGTLASVIRGAREPRAAPGR